MLLSNISLNINKHTKYLCIIQYTTTPTDQHQHHIMITLCLFVFSRHAITIAETNSEKHLGPYLGVPTTSGWGPNY